MPEATMDEDCQLPPGKGDVRATDVSSVFSIYPPVKTITGKTRASKGPPDYQLRLGIRRFVCHHHIVDGR